MKKVAVFVGSPHAESINLKFAKALAKLADSKLDFKFIEIADLPHYDDALWANPPAAALRLKDEIAAADAVLFVTPEFNRSIPGILKNAIDWGSRPWGQSSWAGKPGSIIGTTPGATGTSAAQAHLRSIMVVLEVALMGQPEVYFQTTPGLIDEDFEITDQETRRFLEGYLSKFGTWIERFAPEERRFVAAE
ncbi:MAG: NADPH-dependent FMN reductase [Devosia sp.]